MADFLPRQASARDAKDREAMLFKIQQLTIDRAMFVPIMALRALMGLGRASPEMRSPMYG
ncbi:MAG TPA: hypothetical protein VLX67_08400 [Stellaceae bacterium]|nr:hypothetical protein [Stellaceae bacterium]